MNVENSRRHWPFVADYTVLFVVVYSLRVRSCVFCIVSRASAYELFQDTLFSDTDEVMRRTYVRRHVAYFLGIALISLPLFETQLFCGVFLSFLSFSLSPSPGWGTEVLALSVRILRPPPPPPTAGPEAAGRRDARQPAIVAVVERWWSRVSAGEGLLRAWDSGAGKWEGWETEDWARKARWRKERGREEGKEEDNGTEGEWKGGRSRESENEEKGEVLVRPLLTWLK